MRSYTVIYTAGEPDWTAVPVLPIDHPYLQTPPRIRAYGQICYSGEALLVHLWAEVPQIRAVEQGPLGMPCEDSCLEFFFQPVKDDPRYINLEFNFNGCFFLGMGENLPELIRLVPECDMTEIFQPDIRRTETGWEIFYRLPYGFIRRLFPDFAIRPGDTLRANCFACSDLSEPAYYLSWNRVATEPFTFHRSECFGSMILENH